MDRIGVRELRQHASRYLERVEHGETIEVTDRGRPVARLVPIVGDPWEELIASGRVTPASRPGGILDEPPLPDDGRPTLSSILSEMRTDER